MPTRLTGARSRRCPARGTRSRRVLQSIDEDRELPSSEIELVPRTDQPNTQVTQRQLATLRHPARVVVANGVAPVHERDATVAHHFADVAVDHERRRSEERRVGREGTWLSTAGRGRRE